LLYGLAGTVQFVAGIYYMLQMPIFQLGSNVWTGAWVSYGAIRTSKRFTTVVHLVIW
jgi:hypothetical protein